MDVTPHRWATAAVLRWRPRPELDRIPTLQIHGDADATFPIRYVRPDVVIRGGGHVLPVTHADELAQIITQRAAQMAERSRSSPAAEAEPRVRAFPGRSLGTRGSEP